MKKTWLTKKRTQKLPPGRFKKVLKCSVPPRFNKLYNNSKNVGTIPADFQTWTLQKRSSTEKIIANFIKGNPNLPFIKANLASTTLLSAVTIYCIFLLELLIGFRFEPNLLFLSFYQKAFEPFVFI